jgi:hypothetical protein
LTQYKSLEALAAEFERRAENAEGKIYETRAPKSALAGIHKLEAETWRAAAVLLRSATLSDLGDPPVFRVDSNDDEIGFRAIRYRANGLKAIAGYLHGLKSIAEKEAEQQTDPTRHWQALGQADAFSKAREIISLVEIEPNLAMLD